MKLRAAFSLAALALLAGNASPAAVTVTVTGIAHTRGTLIACLWSEKKGFPTCQKSPSASKQTVAITGSTMRLRFRNVAPGSYAVSVQHDEDGDGKLKTNFIGMPKEGVGISNNPGGIPGWQKAQVEVSGDTALSIRMRYL